MALSNNFYSSSLFFRIDVYNFFLIYSLHCVLANLLFFLIFVHIFKSFLYSSNSLIITKFLGFCIFLFFCLICFTGYLLPFGQMSFWGGVVIFSLFTVLPFSNIFLPYVFGDFGYSSITISRIFTVHFILPFLTLIFVLLHIYFLHLFLGSNYLYCNIFISVNFFPFIFLNDILLFCFLFNFVLYYIYFNSFSFYEFINFNAFNNLVTPIHIVPEWYFLFWYGILKLYTSKTFGVLFFVLFLLVVYLFMVFNKVYLEIELFFVYLFIIYIIIFVYMASVLNVFPYNSISLFIYVNLYLMYSIFYLL